MSEAPSKTSGVLVTYKIDVILDNIEHLRWRLEDLDETPENETERLKIQNSITHFLRMYDEIIQLERDRYHPHGIKDPN